MLTTPQAGPVREGRLGARHGAITGPGRPTQAEDAAKRPHPDDGGPNVPLASLVVAVPCVAVVALLCIVWRPGVLATVLALALTPVAVFAVTLAGVILARHLRLK